MQEISSYEKIGRFVVMFQDAERRITELLVLMEKADSEFIRILVNELEYSKRIKTTDVMFNRFVGLLRDADASEKQQFHDLMTKLSKLGERRNEIVHSTYLPFIDVNGVAGLRRKNSKLKATEDGQRQRIVKEEDLLPESFSENLENLSEACRLLETFRIKIIDWLYPDVEAVSDNDKQSLT